MILVQSARLIASSPGEPVCVRHCFAGTPPACEHGLEEEAS